MHRLARQLLGCLFVMLVISSCTTADSEPPTAPSNLNAVAVSSSEIQLSWDQSTDNLRVSHYELQRNGTSIATTTKTSFNDSGLQAETGYLYEIVASDGKSLSAVASFTLSTLANGETDDTNVVASTPGKLEGGKYEPAIEEPTERGSTDLFEFNTSSLTDLATSELTDLDTSDSTDLDTSDLTDLDTSDLTDLDTRNSTDPGTTN